MDDILDELITVPGVIGALIYRGRKGVVEKRLPAVFKNETLKQLGRLLVKMYNASRMTVEDVAEISLFYEEATVVLRHITEDSYLVVLADPASNPNLVAISLNLAMEELKSTSRRSTAAVDAAILTELKAARAASGNNGHNAQELLASGPLAEPLQTLQFSLAKVVGPIAKVMFQEALEKWVRQVDPSPEVIPSLIDILRNEIGDNDRFDDYRRRISIVVPESE